MKKHTKTFEWRVFYTKAFVKGLKRRLGVICILACIVVGHEKTPLNKQTVAFIDVQSY